MNYANMIEEKNLKKTFIIATLVSTLVGTFTSSLGLYERINQKRQQKHVDKGQDDEIKKLRKEVEDMQKQRDEPQPQQRRLEGRPNDNFGDSLERSGALIQREFEDNYARMGKRYAMGDTLTENQLQAQVIMLQQTVINVLQDALYNNRTPDRIDMEKLLAASEAARGNSIEALRGQYQRMLTQGPQDRRLSLPAIAAGTSVTSSRRSSPSPPPPADASPLFCRYSLDLQSTRQPLHPRLRAGGDLRCPACLARVAHDPNDVWKVVKESKARIKQPGFEKEVVEERAFHLTDRFVIKCHREDGEFACVLCNRNRKVDTICASVETLVRHVGRVHEVDEYEREIDIWEFGGH